MDGHKAHIDASAVKFLYQSMLQFRPDEELGPKEVIQHAFSDKAVLTTVDTMTMMKTWLSFS